MSNETYNQESPFIRSPHCNSFDTTFNIQPEAVGKTMVRSHAHRRSSNLQTSIDFMKPNKEMSKTLKHRRSNF